MDIADINKVANRKRINVEAEKLREKVSRETAKIIKLKVAQDTAYWDLKEKLQQLENNHERLQQNMVDVQMQHETISGQYQDELRLRPETLNKLTSTREICDLLEDYSERLKETLSRCKVDYSTLVEAYQKSGQFVKDIKQKQQQADEKNSALIASLQEKLELKTDHNNQMVTFFNTYKQQSDGKIHELKNKLEATQTERDDLVKIAKELTRDLDEQKHSIDMKDKNILSLENDMKRLLHEYNSQSDDLKNNIKKLEKELAQSNESVESLKKALTNQEQLTITICEQKSSIQEKLSSVEEESSKLYDEIKNLKQELKAVNNTNETLFRDIITHGEAKKSLEKDVAEKNELLHKAKEQIESLTSQLEGIKIEKDDYVSELTKAKKVAQDKATSIEQMEANIANYQTKIAELEEALQQCRTINGEKIRELNGTIEIKQNENTSKGETISKLMNEITMSMEVRNRLETNIDKMKKELEVEREKGLEKERKSTRQIEHLQAFIKDKEKELSKHMSIILELRGEKERLHEKIAGMQGIIDNVQKELTGPVAPRPPPQEQPEQDDNAVSLTPASMQKKSKPSEKLRSSSEFAIPTRTQPKQQESLLYNIFSDSSMDENTVDQTEVNRRFESISRGECLPALPLSTLKRRRGDQPQSQRTLRPEAEDEDAISLSQLRGDTKKKGNTFFRTKRAEQKLKKFRPSD